MGRPGRVYLFLTLAYVAFLVYGCLVPLDFHGVPFGKAVREYWPTLLSAGFSRADVLANVTLYVPLAFLAMGALTRENRRPHRWLAAAAVMVAGLGLSFWLEFSQMFVSRSVSIHDVTAQTLGSAVGIAAWLTFGGLVSRWGRGLLRPAHAAQRTAHVLYGYAVFIVFYQFLPFDFTFSTTRLIYKVRHSGRFNVVPFRDLRGLGHLILYMVVVKTAILIPVGYLLRLLTTRRTSPLMTACLAGAGFAAAVEALQFFAYSRVCNSGDVILGALGACLGAWVADRVERTRVAGDEFDDAPPWPAHAKALQAVGLVLMAAFIAWLKWYPFDFAWPSDGLAAALHNSVHVPLFHQYYQQGPQASAGIAREFVLFCLVGMLWQALLSARPRGGRAVAETAVLLTALTLEAGRLFVGSRRWT